MRVSFLKPPIGGILGLEMITFVEPLGLECVAGALEQEGHECQVVDLRIDGREAGLAKARAFDPQVVGLQCNFTTERYRAMDLVQRVRRKLPDAVIVLGGHDASREPEWFHHHGIDIVAIGDGEEVMPALVRALEQGSDLTAVPGLFVETARGPVKTPPAGARRKLDDLPMPARHLIDDYADQYYINFRRPLALMETARGCPFKCNFCSVWKFHESTFREKSPERVVRELQEIRAPNVFITDDIFWMNVKRGHALADAIKKSGIRKHFTIQTRSDIICKFPDLIEAWKDCGRMTVFLGLESVTDEGLEQVNKKNTAEKNNRAIEILQELEIGYTPNFIVDPGWERADFDRLKRWIDKTGAFNSGFSVLTPLPGTDLWDEVKGDVSTDDWELFDITHAVLPTRLPLHEFYRELAGLWSHAMDVRYREHGRMRTYVNILLALASRRVTVSAMRKGMRMGKVLGRPKTFLAAHESSAARVDRARATLTVRPRSSVTSAAPTRSGSTADAVGARTRQGRGASPA